MGANTSPREGLIIGRVPAYDRTAGGDVSGKKLHCMVIVVTATGTVPDSGNQNQDFFSAKAYSKYHMFNHRQCPFRMLQDQKMIDEQNFAYICLLSAWISYARNMLDFCFPV